MLLWSHCCVLVKMAFNNICDILLLETGGFITQFYPYMLTRLVIYLMEYYTPKVFNSILLQRQVSSIINSVNDLQNRPLTIY